MPSTISAPAPINYQLRSFANQTNVILLGGAVLFSLAFASWLPLALGASLEALWLLVAPRTKLFRKVVDADRRRVLRAQEDAAQKALLAALRPEHARRFRALGAVLDDLRKHASSKLDVNPFELADAVARLEATQRSFLQIAALEERLARHIAETPRAALEEESRRLLQDAAIEKDLVVRLTLRQAANMAQKRIQHAERVAMARRSVTVALDTVEQALTYLRAQAAAANSGRTLLADVDAVLRQLTSVEALTASTDELLGSDAGAPSSTAPVHTAR